MMTFHGKQLKQYMGGALVVPGKLAITFLMGGLAACASIPRDPNYDGSMGGGGGPVDVIRCPDMCWVMSARNDNYFEARVYVNGHRMATIPGMAAKDVAIPIARSMLDGSGCIQVFVKLFPDTKAASSSKACPVPGSHLELAINESYGEHPLRLSLQDWRKR